MKKETGGLLNKKIINENRNDRNYHDGSSSQNHSKSPSHTGNYLNVSKSKNQFSQSQIERSYTGSSNNMKSGYNSNNNQMLVSKYRDKSLPGSTTVNNYLESQSSQNSNYASYKDSRSKSRDLSGGKQIISTPTHKKVSSVVGTTPKANIISGSSHYSQNSHNNFSNNNYVNPNSHVSNNYTNYSQDREKNSYNNLNIPENSNMNLTMKNNMISSQSSQIGSKNLKNSSSSNYISQNSKFSNSNIISDPVSKSNYLNAQGPNQIQNQSYNYISNNYHSGNKNDEYLENDNYLKYSQTSKKNKVPPSGKVNVNIEKYRDRSAKSNTGNSNLNSSQNSFKNFDEYKGNPGNLTNKSQTEDSVYTKYKQIKRTSVPSSGNNYIDYSPSTKNNGNNYLSKNHAVYIDQSANIHENNNIYNHSDKINSSKIPERLESNFSFKNYTVNPNQYKAAIQQIPIQTSGNKKTYSNTHTENSLQISKYSNHSQHETNNLNDSRILTDTSKSRQNLIIHLEKKDSFSLLKINSVGSGLGSEHNHQTADSNLNKETSDSLKYRMTNTHSSGGHIAIHSLEEVKAIFNKLDPEEYHLVSVNLIQSSKHVVRMHEHVPDRDNLFTTVTKCEERDL